MNGRTAGIMMWLLATLAASAHAQTVEYLHTDALGSVVAVTNANRTVLERREYEPYGHQLTPAVTNGPGYTGHVQDAATGLVYMQQRYYDAQIGRFLSVDPVAARVKGDNFNRYAYAFSNPYHFTDPTGTEGVGCWNNGSGCGGAGALPYGLTEGGAAVLGVAVGFTPVGAAMDAYSTASAIASGDPAAVVSAVVGVVTRKVDAVADAGKAAQSLFRGAKPGDAPSFSPKPGEAKVDAQTGTVKPTHGVSVFDNPESVSSKGFVPHEVDQSTIPDSLQVIQRGKDPSHYEITPKPNANLTPDRYKEALECIRCK